jgi:hypothetical protein
MDVVSVLLNSRFFYFLRQFCHKRPNLILQPTGGDDPGLLHMDGIGRGDHSKGRGCWR